MTVMGYFYYSLWYQITYQIMAEDILKYSPTVMFRVGHPVCRSTNECRE